MARLIVDKVKNGAVGEGFDVLSGKYVNMMHAGIVDPAKVTRSALQNAASVSAMVLTTEAAVVEEPKDKESMGGMPGGMHGGMPGMM